MTTLEDALASNNNYAESPESKDTAGANAGSRADMVFITTSPLSELVWSPKRGLSIKYAKPSLSRRRSSLLWNTEAFNIMILPCANDGEGSNSRGARDKNLAPMHSEEGSVSNNLQTLTRTSHPQTNSRMHPVKMIHEQDLISFQEENRKKKFHSKSDKHYDDDAGKLVNGSPLFSSYLADGVDKVSGPTIPGMPKDDIKEEGKWALTAGSPYDHLRNSMGMSYHYSQGLEIVSASEGSMKGETVDLLKSSANPRDSDRGHFELAMDTGGNNKMTCHLGYFHLTANYSVDGGSDKSKLGRTAVSQPSDAFKGDIGQASHTDIAPALGVPNNTIIEWNVCEAFDTGDRQSISSGNANSHESVESNNSEELLSEGKRARSCELEISSGSKRIKKETNHNTCFASRDSLKGSSFLNWVSSMMNRLPRSHQSLPVLVQPVSYLKGTNMNSPSVLHDKQVEVSGGRMGFQSIFHALFNSSSQLHYDKFHDTGFRNELGLLKEQAPTQNYSACSTYHEDNDDLDLQNTSPRRAIMVNAREVVHGELLKCDDQISSGDNYSLQQSNLCGGLNRDNIKKSTSFAVNGFSGPRCDTKGNKLERKIVGNLGDGTPGYPGGKATTGKVNYGLTGSEDLSNDKRNFHESLWVTRLSPKPSSNMPNPGNPNQASSSEVQMLPSFCDASNSLSQNNTPCRLDNNLNNGPYSLGCGQKLRSEFNSLQPSSKFHNFKPIASTFAKRLDAFKHSVPVKHMSTGDSATNCLFCGESGHTLNYCLKLTESQQFDLLSDITFFNDVEKCSCICICCFQLNHWAISCPNILSERKKTTENDMLTMRSENYANIMPKPYKFSGSCDGRIVVWSGGKQEKQQMFGTCRVSGDIDKTGRNLHHEVPCKVASCTAKGLSPDEKSSRERSPKQILMENVSGSNQTLQRCDSLAQKQDDVSGIFSALRRLRLSRSDILRCLAAPTPNFKLDGFFLRLRLGKRKTGVCRTGYHVARINGATSEDALSVSIGNLQHFVDSRFVSNYDFEEDELKAWWSETTMNGGKLPSGDELNNKLIERLKMNL